jgi:hypothetical protein
MYGSFGSMSRGVVGAVFDFSSDLLVKRMLRMGKSGVAVTWRFWMRWDAGFWPWESSSSMGVGVGSGHHSSSSRGVCERLGRVLVSSSSLGPALGVESGAGICASSSSSASCIVQSGMESASLEDGSSYACADSDAGSVSVILLLWYRRVMEAPSSLSCGFGSVLESFWSYMFRKSMCDPYSRPSSDRARGL